MKIRQVMITKAGELALVKFWGENGNVELVNPTALFAELEASLENALMKGETPSVQVLRSFQSKTGALTYTFSELEYSIDYVFPQDQVTFQGEFSLVITVDRGENAKINAEFIDAIRDKIQLYIHDELNHVGNLTVGYSRIVETVSTVKVGGITDIGYAE